MAALLQIHDKDVCLQMNDPIMSVEEILNYKFKDKNLLENALTHSSYTKSESYEYLELVGDSALGTTITNYAYVTYPKHDPGVISRFRAANVSTEKLARVAIRNGLYKYVRHNSPSLDHKVTKFIEVVQEEENIVFYGGTSKAPKVLADIVESVIGAVHVDLQFDLKATWLVVGPLLEPIITPAMLHEQPHPVSKLFDLCQKKGHKVNIKHSREYDKTIASVYIDSKLIASASSDQKENATLHAAMAALEKSTQHNERMDISLFEIGKSGGAKRKLEQISQKRKWSKPTYRVVKEFGPPHAKIYVSSVTLEVDKDSFCEEGQEMPRLKEAKDSAAIAMLRGLQDKNLL